MKKNYISEVISHFLKGNYNEETERKIQHWMIDEGHAEEKESSLQDYWDSLQIESDQQAYQSLNEVKSKLGMNIPADRKLKRRQFLRVAAVLIPFFILAAAYFYFRGDFTQEQWVKISSAYGESKEIALPDGSTVWLNAGSCIEYPEHFSDKERHVKLIGEAFFSVEKDASKPFIVDTKNITVKVLGTTFNVAAYPNEEKTITTLNSGKVEIHTASSEIFTLEPAQELAYHNQTYKTTINSVSDREQSGWMSGDLVFDYKFLSEILASVERKFDVAIESDKSLLENNNRFSVKFINGENVIQVMDVLREVCGFSYTKNDREIVIKPL